MDQMDPGKTSFCEAFEYKLTSNVKEAKRRNIKVNNYIKRNNKKPNVRINFRDSEFSASNLSEMEKEYYQICFVEKNRLQEFALLGSRDTGVKEQDIIASLLGLEELDNLVSSFVMPKSFDLTPLLKNDCKTNLENLRHENVANLTLKEDKEKELQNIKDLIYKKYRINPSELDDLIEAQKNNYESKEKEIDVLKHNKIVDQDYETAEREINKVVTKYKRYENLAKKFTEEVLKINHISFYENLKSIFEDQQNEKCPACETPIKSTNVHPLQKAEKELEHLKDIVDLEKEKKKLEADLNNESYEIIARYVNGYKNNSESFENLKQEELENLLYYLNEKDGYYNRINYIKIFLDNLKKNSTSITNYFSELKRVIEEVKQGETVIKELKKSLSEINSKITELNTYKTQLESAEYKLKGLESSLEDFTNKEKHLKQEFKKKRNIIGFLKTSWWNINIFIAI
ncbi:hypothetical protein [Salinicoccus sp. CNSTN-B1]